MPASSSKQQPAIRAVLLPCDTNVLGTIFGGVILSYIDHAGLVEARKTAFKNFAAVAMRDVEFVAPAFAGDLVSFYTRTVRVGHTSITVEVTVEAQ